MVVNGSMSYQTRHWTLTCYFFLAECTQLRLLGKDDVALLLQRALPTEWSEGKTVLWYPRDKNHNHPPEDWIKLVWKYLRDHFKTPKSMQRLANLPLIPLSLSQRPVILTRLCNPSTVVVKSLNDGCIDEALTDVLTKLGLIVSTDCPTFITNHPAVWGSILNRISVQGVLKAMVVSSTSMGAGNLSEVLQRNVSTEGKRVLRSFLADVRSWNIGVEERKLLCSLPVFETLFKRFVSKNDGLCAAPLEPLPIATLRELVDISQDDSKKLAVLLNVRVLKLTEFLCDVIFPDIQQRKYPEEQIDKLMSHVLKHLAHLICTDVNFKRNMQALSFVPKQNQRVRASDLFDPRNDFLKKIFANENVFPIGALYNEPTVLVMLEELGMKNERSVTAGDLFQSAKQVKKLPHLPTAKQKSEAIFQYLSSHPQKLREPINGEQLGALLRNIRWVSRLRQRTPNFPASLSWWGADEEEERHFFKPAELKSHQLVNLLGTVMPVVHVQPSSAIANYFGWQVTPDVFNVVEHLRNVIASYCKEDKPFYMVVVNEIYSFLKHANCDAVNQAFHQAEVFEWVWNGDGFSSPNQVLSSKPPIDLTPYMFPLPSEMLQHSNLFHRFGMREQSDPDVLLQVLGMMKEKYDSGNLLPGASDAKHDLQLAVDILNEVASKELSSELKEKVLLPTHYPGDFYVRLQPVERCMYCEREDWLKLEVDDGDKQYFYVHPNVPIVTAERLNVPSRTNRMLDPDELFTGEEFGQEERLTTRLNRLLEDYTDGFAVLKELIQNADDAGATEVRFLYDERTNEDAMSCLIDEGMKGCQGPALWVYNDATFKDEDFVNITKLNEATKLHDTEKIGRFGLGFNAVYNLTDVPMFVSKNYFAIFDPHTTYLGKAIKNKRKPGMRINLNKGVQNLRTFTNQFKPFNGVFGCDLRLDKEDNSFDGTLFRFPLRTREQAARSEIKKLCYNDQEMRELLKMFLDRAKSLLLFTQNVLRVEIYSGSRLSSQEIQPALIFQVTKSILQGGILRELSVPITLPVTAEKLDPEQKRLLKQCNFLQASSKVARQAKSCKVAASEFPESSIAFNVACSFTETGLHFFNVDHSLSQVCEAWLVVSSMGDGRAMAFAKSDHSLLPAAGVAVQLVPTKSDSILPSPVTNGTIFCYLPLPIHSGLPVHINGAFAVSSNRRHLKEKLEDDKMCYGVEWNDVLMEDSIAAAYLCLLEDAKQIVPKNGPYVFHSLWPRTCKVSKECIPILKSFYRQLASGAHSLFSNESEWIDISQVVFLHPDLRKDVEIGEASFAVLQHLAEEGDVVIDLPTEVFESFICCGLTDVIRSKTYDERRFFLHLFFPNILKVPSNLRDILVLHALRSNRKDFDESIKMHACIPTSPGGKILKCPSQLVNPYKEASSLFCPEDARFPYGEKDTFLNSQLLTKLEELGMKSDDLPWEDIAERAESVQRLNDVNSKVAVKRVKIFLEFVEKKLRRKAKGPSQTVLNRLLDATFLPVLQKPESFPLPWKGQEFLRGGRLLLAPKDIFLKEKMYLVCCTEPIVDRDIPKKVKELLKLESKEVPLEKVTRQLEEAISIDIGALDGNGYEQVRHICTTAYSFLQDNMANYTAFIKQILLRKRFILIDRRFLCARQVAFEVKTDYSPYLYTLPEDLSERYSNFMKFAGVRKQFEAKDYILSLQELKRQFNEMQLDDRTLQVTVNMAEQLALNLLRLDGDSSNLDKWGPVYLPDSTGMMRAVPELCFKDCPWMPDDPDEHFVHEKITWSTCKQLGVTTRRDETLQRYDVGLPFGQKEKLTNRLKRILTGYPGEKEILKELLQNADDAQATEICFIKDPRHHPDKRVFKDSWKPLQGPALCVYNNMPFTNADIKGICNLGEGSKGEDPNKTGQYGVGFNAVYHLTDVPSFISKGEEIEDVLCVFDPHCRYIPHSSEARPGRMFQNIEPLRRKFPDVFPCYLEEHFPIENATMFRFPLRTREMAEESQISQIPVTVEKLDAMMEELKKELFEVLLFVNNVKKISISAIDESRNLANTYFVQVVMSPDDDRERQGFAHYMKEIGKQMKEENLLPTSIKVKKCTYTMKLRDSLGREEKWLIVQQVGFEKPVNESIVDAFKEHQLGILPRGGVACLLESTFKSHMQRKKKAYCFLPLPFETDLPVHINGHFALDHETRRKLWRDEVGGCRSDWNNALLCDAISSCYLTLLDKVRGFIQLPVGSCNASCSRGTILSRLSTYEKLFPSYPIEDPNWRTLAISVYQEMTRKEMRLIPLVRGPETSSCRHANNSHDSGVVHVKWFPPTGCGKDQTYFNNLGIEGFFAALRSRSDESEEERKRREEYKLKQKKNFEETLLETGFNLVAFSLTVFHSFKEAGVEVCCVSPSAVVDFYKSFSDADPLCSIGAIPCPVDKTAFKSQGGVIRVLKYCRDDENFVENLSGLPLLLTQDNHLHSFSENHPRCLSQYADILPHSPSLFVHARVYNEVFNGADCKKAAVFRPLDVNIFASQLHLTLPPSFRSEGQYVKWCPDKPTASLPNRCWIYRVWDFLQDFASDTVRKQELSQESRHAYIRDMLLPLSKWSILPATETCQSLRPQLPCSLTSVRDKQIVANHFLVPLSKAESVLDFKECGESSEKLVEALRNLGLPELNSVVLTTMNIDPVCYTKKDSYELARELVATIKTPHSLLIALNQRLQWNRRSLEGKLKLSDSMVVLDFFSRNTERLKDEDKETLRKLPFYPKANGGLTKLEGMEVFVLPGGIPKVEMDVVESKVNCLFLESRQRLSELYEFLEVQCLSPFEVYMKFVLKCFQHLSLEGKLAHLGYIRDKCISSTTEKERDDEGSEEKRLLDYLRVVEFIPSKDGTLKTASSFYDPYDKVFRTMLPEDRFPPEPFDSYDWLSFLKKIGLVQDVSKDDFVKFANHVAQEAETGRTDVTYKKSEVLVHHLISRPNVVGEGLLQVVRGIPFVVAHPVKEPVQELCPSMGKLENGEIPFIAFSGSVVSEHEKIVWTKAHLLPRSADPRIHRYLLDCPHGKIDKYLNHLLEQLQVLRTPSVDLVISHCQTICNHLSINNENENVSREQCLTKTAVMESIYTFLQDSALKNSEAKLRLKTTRCILVEGGRRFILPEQAVLELYEHLEIKPFLYRVPPVFGKFQSLFESIGCSKYVKPSHYALVLKMLHAKCQSDDLHPNELRTCRKAVEGFFNSLQLDTEDLSTLSKLYLPAMPSGRGSTNKPLNTIPVTLCRSTELIFDDAPTYGTRIHGLNQPLVLDLSLMNVSCKSGMDNYEDLMKKLPPAVRPMMLSAVVKETLIDPENTAMVTSGAVNALKQQLSSLQISRGIARIIKHANFRKKDFEEGVIASIEKGLRSIQLVAVQSLKTSLLYNNKMIPGSEDEVQYFKERVELPDGEIWRVYINAATGMADSTWLSTLVANVIGEMYGELLGMKALVIPEMLRCSPAAIGILLDRMDIRKDDSFHAAEMNIYPEPGTLIPIEDHHLLNDAFTEFEPGDYVGYQLYDPSLDQLEGTATYIYAIVIEEVTDKGADVLTKRYRICIGHDREPVVVDATDLHEFHRLREIFDGQPECHRNRQEVFEEISRILEDAWELPEKQRLQIVKRLYMQWDPQNNFGDEEFYRGVLQHIRDEVTRLGGSYKDLFSSLEARAMEHGSQRKEYRRKFSRQYGAWGSSSGHSAWRNLPPSFCTRNPQPGEARRWFRQAEVDVRAGSNEIASSRPSYEWACFKCHQVKDIFICSIQRLHFWPAIGYVIDKLGCKAQHVASAQW